MTRNLFFTLTIFMMLCNCSTKQDVQYLQDMTADNVEYVVANTGIIIEPNDLLSIIISTKDPELASIFNNQPGTINNTTISNDNTREIDYGYRVNSDGDINFPILGCIHVSGLNREEVSNLIKKRIQKEGLIKELSVSVSFLNFKISVLGDVKNPGNFIINDDKFTIFQALAEAGDMNITGERNNVMVIREKNGKRNIYTLDMTSKSIFNSPAYYLQQNDVVYVVPNEKKAGERDINTNTWKQVGTWTGLISIAASLATLIITLSK